MAGCSEGIVYVLVHVYGGDMQVLRASLCRGDLGATITPEMHREPGTYGIMEISLIGSAPCPPNWPNCHEPCHHVAEADPVHIEREVKAMKKPNWKTSLVGIVTCLLPLAMIWAPAEYEAKVQATAGRRSSSGRTSLTQIEFLAATAAAEWIKTDQEVEVVNQPLAAHPNDEVRVADRALGELAFLSVHSRQFGS